MSTPKALHQEAAQSLTALLPSSAPLELALWPLAAGELPVDGAATVGVEYIGGISAELAIALAPAAAAVARAAGGSPLVSLADVLRPALDAAASALGSGVLGETRTGDASALFLDAKSSVFRLSQPGSLEPYAFFAIKTLETSAASAAGMSTVSAAKLGRISDVEMALTVVIGRTRMSVGNVMGLEPGDVVDLDRSAGAPADVLLNGRLIAHGEVVVVDQDYAVRITKILDAAETVS